MNYKNEFKEMFIRCIAGACAGYVLGHLLGYNTFFIIRYAVKEQPQ